MGAVWRTALSPIAHPRFRGMDRMAEPLFQASQDTVLSSPVGELAEAHAGLGSAAQHGAQRGIDRSKEHRGECRRRHAGKLSRAAGATRSRADPQRIFFPRIHCPTIAFK
jgi:hypothetical protein